MWTLSYSPSKLETGSNLITSLKRCERVYSPILPLPRRSKRMKQELLGRVKEKRTPEPPGNACRQSSTSAWRDLPTRHRGAMKVERAGAGLRLQRSVSGAEQAPGTSCPAPPAPPACAAPVGSGGKLRLPAFPSPRAFALSMRKMGSFPPARPPR